MTTVPTPSRTAKAIETRYAGHRFRSRLEARWAVFFDTLGVAWQYEPEGFELPSGRYLPDFLLPDLDVWFEVKGDGHLPARDANVAVDLCAATGRRVAIGHGSIKRQVSQRGYCCGLGPVVTTTKGVEARRLLALADEIATYPNGMLITDTARNHYCSDWSRILIAYPGRDHPKRATTPISDAWPHDVSIDSDYAFCACPWCGRLGLEYEARGARVCGWQAHHATEAEALAAVEPAGHWRADDKCYTGNDPRIVEAYRAARSARFEHGESGR